MANIVWPTSLPDFEKPQRSNYTETPGSTAIRTKMEVGPAKVRQRTTASVDSFSVGYWMSEAQAKDFKAFYQSTLKHGSLRFDATHPRTGLTEEFRIKSEPTIEPLSGIEFVVSFEVEVMP